MTFKILPALNPKHSKKKNSYSIENLHNYPVDLTVFEAEPQSRNSKLTAQTRYSIEPLPHLGMVNPISTNGISNYNPNRNLN